MTRGETCVFIGYSNELGSKTLTYGEHVTFIQWWAVNWVLVKTSTNFETVIYKHRIISVAEFRKNTINDIIDD